LGQKVKIIETHEGDIDLAVYNWDDDRFSKVLMAHQPMEDQQARSISRFVREAIDELKIHRITAPVVDALLNDTLEQYGLPRISSVPLDKNLFIRNGLNLSDNVTTVLERRYLRKDTSGQPIEKPAQMFRRVARHIASAETNYDPDADLQPVVDAFYNLMTGLQFPAQLAHSDERRTAVGPTGGLLRAAGRRQHGGIFDSLKNAAIDPQIRRGDRVLLFAPAAQATAGWAPPAGSPRGRCRL
jgi:ribonucleoside-diphosphate reductase alpha chain